MPSFDDVLARFDTEIATARAQAGRWGYFACLYRAVTIRVREGCQQGAFEDPARMERLVGRFAEMYFDALNRWRMGIRPTRAWKVAFETASKPGLLVLQHMALGINAHVNVDLAVATAFVAGEQPISGLKADFDAINERLASLIDEIEGALATKDKLIAGADVVLGRLDERFANFSLRRARDEAWMAARLLSSAKPALHEAIVRLLDRRAALLGQVVATPLGPRGELAHWLEPGADGEAGVAAMIDLLAGIGERKGPAVHPAAPAPSGRWTDTLLDDLRSRVDEGASGVVRALLEDGGVAQVNQLMRGLTHNADFVPAELPEPLRGWLVAEASLPEWADPRRIALAQRLFVRHGLQALQVLLYRALPECFASANGAEVLIRSRRIEDLTHKRLIETVQFLFDVARPGGLEPDGSGIRTAQRVRLLHAAIRAHIERGEWDADRLGRPINLEDQLGTLVSFSALTTEGMQRLGVDLSLEELDAWVHLWNVVGAVLGLDTTQLPQGHTDALLLFAAIRRRNHQASPGGTALTRALLDFADTLVPGTLLDGLNVAFVRYLCGDHLADMLEVPKLDWSARLLGSYRLMVRGGDELGDASEAAGWLAERAGGAFVLGFSRLRRGGARSGLDIPEVLRENWEI